MTAMSIKDALAVALNDLRELSPAQLRAELDKHAGGPLATALSEAQQFIYGENSPLKSSLIEGQDSA